MSCKQHDEAILLVLLSDKIDFKMNITRDNDKK